MKVAQAGSTIGAIIVVVHTPPGKKSARFYVERANHLLSAGSNRFSGEWRAWESKPERYE